MRVAVIGHVEWVEFARVDHVPGPGEIVHALDTWQEPAGGGAVAAVQLARLAGDCLFLTALGDDELGHRAAEELERLGVRVAAAWRSEPQRRAFVHLDADPERTITVIGSRLGPHGSDTLPWDELDGADAVYFTAGDADAVRASRAARRLVATTRANEALVPARTEIDVLVRSARDPGEEYVGLDPPPRFVAETDGALGGVLLSPDGSRHHWTAVPLPRPAGSAYGAGDCFAAGLTFGLAQGLDPKEALDVGAQCGAECMTRLGPY
jgi:ribokinase